MCQCGAQGMAMQGKTSGEILQYYYPGSKLVKAY
jgi:SpoIID/LytB domain protein